MSLAVGTKGYDSANQLDPNAARAAGSRYQMRYAAGAGDDSAKSQWKLTKPGEIAAIRASGQLFGANSEWYETRCTEGATAGHVDGARDLAFWKSRGLAQGCSIYISWDVAPDPAKYSAVAAYVEAYHAALGGYYRADGFYGGLPALLWLAEHSITRHGWIPGAASWNGPNIDIPDNLAPPARTFWDLWFPTASQIAPALALLKARFAGSKMQSCVWQCGGTQMNNQADVNYVVFGDYFGFQGESVPAPPPVKDWFDMATKQDLADELAKALPAYFTSDAGQTAIAGGVRQAVANHPGEFSSAVLGTKFQDKDGVEWDLRDFCARFIGANPGDPLWVKFFGPDGVRQDVHGQPIPNATPKG